MNWYRPTIGVATWREKYNRFVLMVVGMEDEVVAFF